MIPEITCAELKIKLDTSELLTIIDVREDYEREIACIAGSIHIPLGELEDRVSELDKNTTYILQCRSGGRSARAVGILQDAGLVNVKNLVGGITQWARDIDHTMEIY